MKKDAIPFEDWCRENRKRELLALYDTTANSLAASEIAFSSAKLRWWRCPVCNTAWQQSTNKINKIKPGRYNVFNKKAAITYCPYCKGERVSPFYNLLTQYPWAGDCWDYERNDSPPQQHAPNTLKKFYIKCNKCGHQPSKPICFQYTVIPFRCPVCSGGKNREVTPQNCLAAKYPVIAKELMDSRNGGITAYDILPSCNDKLWFCCSHGHVYSARVSNRTYLGRGCPHCAARRKTSFTEQAIYHYIRAFCDRVYNNHTEPHGLSVDIFLPEQRVAIECNSLYYHDTVKPSLTTDIRKYLSLALYYRVYVLTESEKEYSVIQEMAHPLIHAVWIPMFSHSRTTYARYDQTIYELLRTLFPQQMHYPNINILRDQQKILMQYIHTPIEGNFADVHPDLAADWDTQKNGSLRPDMFPPSPPYIFHWICRTCGKSYTASMRNRTKVNPDTCPYCCQKSRYKSPLLSESFPQLRPYWSDRLNSLPFSEASVASGKIAVFELTDGTIVPCCIGKLSLWLYSHPNDDPAVYLTAKRERLKKEYEKPLERFRARK